MLNNINNQNLVNEINYLTGINSLRIEKTSKLQLYVANEDLISLQKTNKKIFIIIRDAWSIFCKHIISS